MKKKENTKTKKPNTKNTQAVSKLPPWIEKPIDRMRRQQIILK